jgi:hypothetical protein
MYHKLKLLRTSGKLIKGKIVEVELWICENCKKYLKIDSNTGRQLHLIDEFPEIKNSECE